jgi:hypothetical protein
MAFSFLSRSSRAMLAAPSALSSVFGAAQRRHLNVHEYVSMALMKEYDVPVPRSAVATTPDEAELAYSAKLGGGGTCVTFDFTQWTYVWLFRLLWLRLISV